MVVVPLRPVRGRGDGLAKKTKDFFREKLGQVVRVAVPLRPVGVEAPMERIERQ